MSTPLRVSRGAVEKFRRYNEELPLRRIGCGTRGGTIDPQTYRPRSDITVESVCNEASLLETRVEESFFLGLTSLSFSFPFDELCEASCVLAFFVTVVVSF